MQRRLGRGFATAFRRPPGPTRVEPRRYRRASVTKMTADLRAVEALFRAALELHAAAEGVEAARALVDDVERRARPAEAEKVWAPPSASGRWADMEED